MKSISEILSRPNSTSNDIHELIYDFINSGEEIKLESDQWDHNESLGDLLHRDSKNKKLLQETIYIDMVHRRHESDDGFGGITLYIPHRHDKGFTNIGINHTGFTYDGDAYFGIEQYESIYKVDIFTGLHIMIEYASAVISTEILASTLTSATDINGKHIDENCASIKVNRFY